MRFAARGSRNLDAGEEPIPDAGLVERLRRRGRRIHTESLLAALVLTGVSLGVPE